MNVSKEILSLRGMQPQEQDLSDVYSRFFTADDAINSHKVIHQDEDVIILLVEYYRYLQGNFVKFFAIGCNDDEALVAKGIITAWLVWGEKAEDLKCAFNYQGNVLHMTGATPSNPEGFTADITIY